LVRTDQLASGYYLPQITSSAVEAAAGGRVDNWTETSTTGAPDARAYHTAVWTGSEMIVWGGYDGTSSLNSGGRYDPATNNWMSASVINAPVARFGHTAVWAGNEMIIWGGTDNFNGTYFNTGGRYNPSTDSWIVTTTTGAPDPRYQHTAVWTDSKMIVWGGRDASGELKTGGRYFP